jgi:4-hydroxyphenylpyruvate dioxygenase
MGNSLGIRGYDYIEFYVGTANKWAYWFNRAMGLNITGYAGPETGVKDRTSFLLSKNNLSFVLTAPLQPGNYDIYGFLQRHGDGVKRWSMEVDDVEKAFAYAVGKGGIPVKKVAKEEDENGFITEAAIKVYDSAEIVFINRDNYKGLFRPGFGEPVHDMKLTAEDTGLQIVDHIVGNVRENEMNLWVDYMNNALNFQTFIDFGPGDISTKYSALLSKVVRSSDTIIRNPVNEPYEGLKKSQIEEYIEEYAGSGIQHIAIRTDDILSSIKAMRNNGMEFLSVPDSYYDLLKEREIKIDENIDDLKELGILCDIEGQGYLLQIFTKPVGDRPTFFFEVIQRKYGSQGFGKGNFQALFESIEREQERRGNL